MVCLHTIDSNTTGPNFLCNLKRGWRIGTKHVGEQAVVAVVRDGDCVVDSFERNDDHDWSEDFFTHRSHGVVAACKKCWANEIALIWSGIAAVDNHFGTFGKTGFNHSLDAAKLHCRNNRTNLGCGVERIANLERTSGTFEASNEFVVAAAVDDHARRCGADLTGMECPHTGDTGNDLFHVSVLEDDACTLATKFVKLTFHGGSAGGNNRCADCRRTGERHHVDIGIGNQIHTGGRAATCNDVDDTLRKTNIFKDLC